jgi:hypothetical protein
MKPCAINGFKKHTQRRFKERCVPFYKSSITELTDEDYFQLCEICKSDAGKYPGEPVPNPTNHPEKVNRCRKIVNLKGMLIWCVYHKKNGIVRTVIPVTTKDITKIVEKRKNGQSTVGNGNSIEE